MNICKCGDKKIDWVCTGNDGYIRILLCRIILPPENDVGPSLLNLGREGSRKVFKYLLLPFFLSCGKDQT